MILQFIAEKQDQILNRGGVRYTHIWGFEEPENNVEMSAAFSMAQGMYETIARHENMQLFMTTHSPIFYKMPSPEDGDDAGLSTNFVERIDNETHIVNKATNEVDVSMGLMPPAPYLDDAKKRSTRYSSNCMPRELSALRVPTVFVEGPTDRQVFQRAWSLFGDPAIQVHINDGGDRNYGSANAIASRSLGWLLEMRHRPKDEIVSAVSIFDADEAGKMAKRELHENIMALGIKTTKFTTFVYPQVEVIRDLIKRGFVLTADLESIYSDEIWFHAEKEGWLEDCANLADRLKPETLQRVLLEGAANPLEKLTGIDRLRVRRRFSDGGKLKAAKYVARLKDDTATNALKGLEDLVEKVKSAVLA
ncbi:ATP-binding protein (plasmid) [Rhizobium leguminosarum]|nr:ATP-binding protein [Rhizobium leguminosarum]